MDVAAIFEHAKKSELTLDEFLETSKQMEQEAFEAIPYSVEDCTFDKGHIKQPIFSCLTCQKANNGQKAGICASCSVQCHSDHEQVELFNRRNFQCDCGTTRLGSDACCNLGRRLGQAENDGNRYDDCFNNTFCICGRLYDPLTEEDEMVQCLACENWLHSKCLMPTKLSADGTTEELVLNLDDFDQLLCSNCVKNDLKNILSRYAGEEGSGFLMIDRSGLVHGLLKAEAETGEKRKRDSSVPAEADEASKKQKLDSTAAAVTGVKQDAQDAIDACSVPSKEASDIFRELTSAQGHLANVYLQPEDWRDRWCQCKECKPLFEGKPYLLEEEEALELPEDEQPQKSIMEVSDEQLKNMPRGPVLDYLRGMKQMTGQFQEWLKGLPKPEDGSKLLITAKMVKDWLSSQTSQNGIQDPHQNGSA